MISILILNNANLKTYKFNYYFNNKFYTYSVAINEDIFKPNTDSLAYVNIADIPIAFIYIEDYTIILKATDTCLLVDNILNETYTSFIPEHIIEYLDANAEFNLYKLNISIEERNTFEFLAYKKDDEYYKEYPIELHKSFNVLDSSLDSFIEELKIATIYFIQGDYLDKLEEYFSDEPWYLEPLAEDDFENFTDYLDTNEIIDSEVF